MANNDETVEFTVRSKVSEVEISGWVAVDEIDDEASLEFVDRFGLPAGHYVPSNPYSEASSYDSYWDYENIKTAFQTDDLFLQLLYDARDKNIVIDRNDYFLIINEGIDLELVSIKKISEEWGGDNLLFTFNIPELPEYISRDLNERIESFNKRSEFYWKYYTEYGNMDHNGHFFETVLIYKDNLNHIMEGNKVIFTDVSITEFVVEELRLFLRMQL